MEAHHRANVPDTRRNFGGRGILIKNDVDGVKWIGLFSPQVRPKFIEQHETWFIQEVEPVYKI